MDYIFGKFRLEVTNGLPMSDSTIDVAKLSAIYTNEFVVINEFISLFVMLIKLKFIGTLFKNLLRNCSGNEVGESSCILGQTDQITYAKGCY